MTTIEQSTWLGDWWVCVNHSTSQPEGTMAEWRKLIASLRARKGCCAGLRLAAHYRAPEGLFKGECWIYNLRNQDPEYPGDYCEIPLDELDKWLADAEYKLDAYLRRSAQNRQ